MKKFLVVIQGPTGVGKTSVSIAVAQHFSTEIISADSRQIFKELNIGVAKPSAQQLQSVPHHFIGTVSIEQNYSAGDFEKEAIRRIEQLFTQHDVLVLTGGSGLYIRAVLEGLDSFPDVDEKILKELNQLFLKNGISALQKLLLQYDPEYYTRVDLENPHRIIRALGVAITTGMPYTSFTLGKKKTRLFIPIKIGLQVERHQLYGQIEKRTDDMINAGLLEEAQLLSSLSANKALQTVGYSEFFEFIAGKITYDQARSSIKKNTRNYAKRQLTWLKKEKNIEWFNPLMVKEIINFIDKQVVIK